MKTYASLRNAHMTPATVYKVYKSAGTTYSHLDAPYEYHKTYTNSYMHTVNTTIYKIHAHPCIEPVDNRSNTYIKAVGNLSATWTKPTKPTCSLYQTWIKPAKTYTKLRNNQVGSFVGGPK